MPYQIEIINEGDKDEVSTIVRSIWGDETIIVHNDIFHTLELDGLKAVQGERIIGILHYQVRGQECEILTLASLDPGKGIGSALLSEVEKIARSQGCAILSLTTTNDNLPALGFYQRKGFHLTAIYPGQVNQSRKLKPGIPEVGEHGIPLRDEIRLEKAVQ